MLKMRISFYALLPLFAACILAGCLEAEVYLFGSLYYSRIAFHSLIAYLHRLRDIYASYRLCSVVSVRTGAEHGCQRDYPYFSVSFHIYAFLIFFLQKSDISTVH